MDAVVLMAYGSPAGPEDVRPYLEDVRGGRPVSDEAVEELAERYRRIGGRSPLDDVTEAQRAALERELGVPVFVGMKHWRPRIAEAVEAALAGGATRIVGLVLAPHYSGMSIGGYRERLEEALGGRAELVLVESWHDEPAFLDVLAERVRGTDAWVIFTAHSLPERILADGDPYREQLLETARLVAERAGLERWSFAFQSASSTGEPWLGPDVLEELERLRADGVGEGARRAGRVRLRPPRDPLGPRCRGAREGRGARARALAHRVAERRSRVRTSAGERRRAGAAGAAGRAWKERPMSSRTCPDWPDLMELAPELQFMHYTVAEAKLPSEALAELVDVPLESVAICADLDRNVFYAHHTDPQVAEALRNTHWFELHEWHTRGPGTAEG